MTGDQGLDAGNPWTAPKLIQWTATYFTKYQIPNPRLDAELLLAHVLRVKRIDLYLQFEKEIPEPDRERFKGLIQRRTTREPLQYLIGETEFWGLTLKVTPDVLIPRPETELLVEWALRFGSPPAIIVDIGTGSGCIAIALAKNLPNAQVIATDSSKEALAVATQNVRAHQLEDRIKLTLADIAPWRVFEATGQKFDLIVSNPPYIAAPEWTDLQPEVRDFEPRRALDGGEDGLDFYRRITQDAAGLLKPQGRLLLEIGETQGEAVVALVQEAGLTTELRKDLAGHDRIVIGTKK